MDRGFRLANLNQLAGGVGDARGIGCFPVPYDAECAEEIQMRKMGGHLFGYI